MTRQEFTDLLEREGQGVYSFCRMLAGNQEEAEELYQETMLMATERHRNIDSEDNPKSYLIVVSLGIYKNRRKKGRTQTSDCAGRGIDGGTFSTTVKNGVLYRIIECDDIALFADRQIYLCIMDTDFYQTEAYNYNEANGTITRKEGYQGINLLMNLPIDSGRADEAKAQTYLRELEASWEAEPEEPTAGVDGIVSTGNSRLDEIILKEREKDAGIMSLDDIPIENLLSYAVLEEESVREVTVGADRSMEYSYFFEDGSGISGTGFVDEEFFAGKTDVTMLGCGYTENTAEFEVCRRDADGKVRCMMYVIR